MDVRDPAEYRAGHLPGSVMAPGGQLVQETDSWLGVWGARVVLVDDTGVQGAHDRVVAAPHGLGCGGARRWARRGRVGARHPAAKSDIFPLAGPEPATVQPVGASGEPGRRRRSGAEPAPPPGPHPRRLVRDPRPARRGARQIAGARRSGADQRGRNDRPLCRGRASHPPAGQGAGRRHRGLESRRVCRSKPAWGRSPASPTTSRCRRATGRADRERYMREYLAWEIDLVNQIARDTDCRFRLAPARIGGDQKMRLSHLIFSLAALGLAIARPAYAEETVNGPLNTVVYFEVDPTEAAQPPPLPGNTPKRAARKTAASVLRCSRRSRGRAGLRSSRSGATRRPPRRTARPWPRPRSFRRCSPR